MLDRITASLSSLAPAEQRVGKLVLLDPRSFASLPVTELAARAHVSKPTVVRFCRSMGYDGLSDFKLKLAGTVSEGVPFIHRSVDLDDKVNDVLVKVIDNNVAAFLKYRNDASTAAIEKAAGALLNTCVLGKRIEFFGAGNSGIVAQDAQHKFFRLGVSTVAYSDGHMQVMSASMMGPGDCVVVISNSGRTRDLMRALLDASAPVKLPSAGYNVPARIFASKIRNSDEANATFDVDLVANTVDFASSAHRKAAAKLLSPSPSGPLA